MYESRYSRLSLRMIPITLSDRILPGHLGMASRDVIRERTTRRNPSTRSWIRITSATGRIGAESRRTRSNCSRAARRRVSIRAEPRTPAARGGPSRRRAEEIPRPDEAQGASSSVPSTTRRGRTSRIARGRARSRPPQIGLDQQNPLARSLASAVASPRERCSFLPQVAHSPEPDNPASAPGEAPHFAHKMRNSSPTTDWGSMRLSTIGTRLVETTALLTEGRRDRQAALPLLGVRHRVEGPPRLGRCGIRASTGCVHLVSRSRASLIDGSAYSASGPVPNGQETQDGSRVR